jgi:hypothetical protein
MEGRLRLRRRRAAPRPSRRTDCETASGDPALAHFERGAGVDAEPTQSLGPASDSGICSDSGISPRIIFVAAPVKRR